MTTAFVPQVAVVDFNHHRGPEIEFWADGTGHDLFACNDWSHLPFLALPDGAHAAVEEFSYFTLLAKKSYGPEKTATDSEESSLFGISCTRQIRSDKLKVKSPDVTRSTVQKAVIVIVDKPGVLGQLRERLAAITGAWFAQEDFSNIDIIKEFQEGLKYDVAINKENIDQYHGLSFREILYEFRYQTLVIFKCLLLQQRMLFFGSRCERLCLTQFALVSLIPDLISNLQDCAHPSLNSYVKTATRVVNLRTTERKSLLAYMGLPLQIFGENSFFSPYTPLQQLDFLSSPSSRSYVVGSTNTLFLSQKEKYSDIVINLDETTLATKVTIINPDLRNALSLSAADRRWIDHLTQTVIDTWDPRDPSRPTTHGYQGSEDAIRLSFEEYVLSLLSSTAYKNYHDSQPYLASGMIEDHRYADPNETGADFNWDFLKRWHNNPNYTLWERLTRDAALFDIVEPRHPTAGGLNIEDVQRRLQGAVSELHLDERVKQGRETAGKVLGAGRETVGLGVARFWKEVENLKERREGSRDGKETSTGRRDDITGYGASSSSPNSGATTASASAGAGAGVGVGAAGSGSGWAAVLRERAAKVQKPDTTQMSAAARDNAAKAGAYLSSWGSWARDRQKEWNENRKPGDVRE